MSTPSKAPTVWLRRAEAGMADLHASHTLLAIGEVLGHSSHGQISRKQQRVLAGEAEFLDVYTFGQGLRLALADDQLRSVLHEVTAAPAAADVGCPFRCMADAGQLIAEVAKAIDPAGDGGEDLTPMERQRLRAAITALQIDLETYQRALA